MHACVAVLVLYRWWTLFTGHFCWVLVVDDGDVLLWWFCPLTDAAPATDEEREIHSTVGAVLNKAQGILDRLTNYTGCEEFIRKVCVTLSSFFLFLTHPVCQMTNRLLMMLMSFSLMMTFYSPLLLVLVLVPLLPAHAHAQTKTHKQAITTPSPTSEEEAWNEVLPAVDQLKEFYDYSLELRSSFPSSPS